MGEDLLVCHAFLAADMLFLGQMGEDLLVCHALLAADMLFLGQVGEDLLVCHCARARQDVFKLRRTGAADMLY
jgi:hypothetical protein